MPQLINWGLIAHPYNWVIVAAMLLIAGFGIHLLTGDASTE